MENEGTGDVLVREDSGQDTRETAVLKGWNQIDGRWYCLDAQTGVWIPRPVLTAEAASYLLDNKLKDLGLYQDEEEELEFKVDYEDGSQLILSVGYEENQDCSTGLIPMKLTGKREPQNLWWARRVFHCGNIIWLYGGYDLEEPLEVLLQEGKWKLSGQVMRMIKRPCLGMRLTVRAAS